MFKLLSTILILTSLLLTGCATNIALKNSDRQSIHTVSVEKKVTKPDGMYLMEPGTSFGMLFGAVGGAVVGGINAQDSKNFVRLAEDNNIDIRRIVRTEFIKSFKKISPFKVVQKNSDAQLQLEIKLYGLTIPNGLSSYLKPTLAVEAKLLRQNKVVWQQNDRVLAWASGMPRYKIDDIEKNPMLLRKMWRAAAAKVSKKINSHIG